MKKILKEKLNILQHEISKIKNDVDNYTKEYISKLEKLIESYKNKLDLNEMDTLYGGTLGFRRAILE